MYKHVHHIRFENTYYPKMGEEIVAKAKGRLEWLDKKMVERKNAIEKLATDCQLKVEDVFGDLGAWTGGRSSDRMTSTQMNDLKHLAERLKAEKDEKERLEIVVRNLPPTEIFKLSFEELEYFDF